jgi:hypothetical protein
MPEKKNSTIVVFDVEPEPQVGPGGRPIQPRGMWDTARKVTGHVLPLDELQQNMEHFVSGVQQMLAHSAAAAGEFALNTVEINAQISANGQVGFMGSGVSTTGAASIKFVLTRNKGK